MSISPQLFTLAGVALGAIASYLVSMLTEHTRHHRHQSGRWKQRKFDTYAAYVSDVKEQGARANQLGICACSVRRSERVAFQQPYRIVQRADGRERFRFGQQGGALGGQAAAQGRLSQKLPAFLKAERVGHPGVQAARRA